MNLFRAPVRAANRAFALALWLGTASILPITPVAASQAPAAPYQAFPDKEVPRPRFAATVEPFSMNLPAGKRLGSVVALCRAPDNSLFILQDVVWANPQLSVEQQLPPVVHISASGDFIGAWGGPEQLPPVDGIAQWPAGLDNIECDADGNIWVLGYHVQDDAAVKFSPEGKQLMRIGQRGKEGDNNSVDLLNGPVTAWLDKASREILFGDGYGNNRIIGFDVDSGKFTRMWGGYGEAPRSPEPVDYDPYSKEPAALPAVPRTFGVPIHRVTMGPDGMLYVCDRANNRLQQFEVGRDAVRFVKEVQIAPGTLSPGSVWDVGFSPDGKYMYIADGMNLRIWVVDRASFAVLGWSSSAPELEGTSNVSTHRSGLHRILVEPNGDILMARTIHGLQRLKFIGVR